MLERQIFLKQRAGGNVKEKKSFQMHSFLSFSVPQEIEEGGIKFSKRK